MRSDRSRSLKGARRLNEPRRGILAGALVPSIALFALGATMAFERDARAFCRTTTEPIPADFVPGGECWAGGHPLYWANACVGYNLQQDASRQVSVEDASLAIAAAFAKWTGTACPTDGTGRSRTSIDVRDMGPVDCGLVQYNQDQGNQHVIVFRDESWPHSDTNNTLALTTVTFNPDTGEIYDADMEINTHDQRVAVKDPIPGDGYDFASIVTHETGHFLGLAHSSDRHATMFTRYTPGAVAMRNLAADDIAGICTIYNPDGNRVTSDGPVAALACDPTPRHGFSTQCGTPQKKSCIPSMAIGGASAPGTSASLLVLGVIACALGARRAARR
jgi:hypothetical protein